MMQRWSLRRKVAVSAFAAVAMAGAVFGTSVATRSQESDKGVLASLISRALSTPATRVSIGSVEGALSSSATIRDITIADRDGVWLQLDSARLVWRRTALLLGRLEVDQLEVGTLRIARPPLPTENPEAVSDQPLLPELPVKVEIKDFQLRTLALGAPVIGVDAQVSASGRATLGKPSEGLDLALDLKRLDARGSLAARLQLVPETTKLDLALKVDEPENGIFANAVNLPGRPPMRLDLTGAGNLDDFAARLDFAAGPDIGANGTAQVRRAGAARQMALNLGARIEGLLPELAAPVFAGTTQLTGNVAFGDDSSIAIPSVSVVSQTARLDVQGNISADQNADLKVAVRAVPNNGQRTAAGGAEIRRLDFDAAITGPLTGPGLTATLAVEDARTPALRLDALNARISATPSGAVTDAATAIPFSATAQGRGIVMTDPGLARAVGRTLDLEAEGTVRNGIADVRTARLRLDSADARFAGRVGAETIQGRATVQAPDLSRFARLAGTALRGDLSLAADLSGTPGKSRIDALLDGRIARFGSGVAAVDGLAGGEVRLTGTLRQLPAGYGVSALRLAGAHITAVADGDAAATGADVTLRIDVPDLARADRQLGGRVVARAKVTGTLQRPDLSANIALTEGRAMGRPIQNLNLRLDATDVVERLNARATMNGSVDGKPAVGLVRAARLDDGGWLLDALDLRVGSATAAGRLTLDGNWLADGRLSIAAKDLNDLSPLAMTALAGELAGDVSLSVANGAQNGALQLRGVGLKVAGASVNRIDARANVTDAYRRPVIDADVTVDRASIAGEDFSQIRLTSRGTAQASDITLAAQARGFALNARGNLVPAEPIRLDLASFEARRGSNRIALANPASFSFADGGIGIRNLAVALGNGRLTVNGRTGPTLDLTVGARAVPLSVADIAMPGLGLAGTLEGNAKVTGSTTAPVGDWSFRIAGLSAPQTRSMGLPPVSINGSGRMADGATTLDATLEARGAGTLRANGRVPFDGGNLDLGVKGQIDAGIANAVIGAGGRRVSGRARVDVRVGGSLSQPEVSGGVNLTGGTFEDAAAGVRLTGINGRVTARGETVVIERLTAQTEGGGPLNVTGNVRIDPGAGFPGDIRLRGQRATLAKSDLAEAIADLDIALSGPLAQAPRVSGRIDFVRLDISIPERLPATLQPIPGTRHVNPPPQVARRLAAQAKANQRGRRAPAFDAALDLTINAPSRIFVRGRGIEAELGGSLRLTGRLAEPVTVGAFDLRRGQLQIAGTRLNFTRGRLDFTGDMLPQLDFLAQTQAADVTVQVGVTGPASQPEFAFTSTPDLPQDEVLSRLLFSKASGSLSGLQALQLAQAAAQFSGAGGPDVFDKLRRSLGVDSLDVSQGQAGGPTVGVRRSINERLSIGVKGGASPQDSGVTLDFDVTRRIRLQGEATGDGNTAVGVGAEWEY